MLHRFGSIAVVAIALMTATHAGADPTPADRSLATELFKEGRALVGEGRIAEACARFEESQRLDSGGGTLLNLALCHEAQGRTATAWAELNEALGIAKRDRRDDRVDLAERHIAAIEAKLARVVIVVPAEVQAEGLAITRDGTPMSRTLWGIAMPVDPGAHTVGATAPGKRPWHQTIDVGASERREVLLPSLEDLPAARPAPLEEPQPPRSVPPTPRRVHDPGSPTQRLVGYVAGGLGVVSIGVGAGFGLDAIAQRKDSDRACPNAACTQAGVDANDRAKRSADVSTVAILSGVAAVALGVYLVLAGQPEKLDTALVVGPAGFGGHF